MLRAAETHLRISVEERGARAAADRMRELEGSIKRMQPEVLKLYYRFGQVYRALVAFELVHHTATLITAFVRETIKASEELEYMQQQFRVLTKSQKEAADMMRYMITFAVKTPFLMKEVVKAAISLRAFGLEATKYIKVIGDWAAMTGRNLTDIAIRFGKVALSSREVARLLPTAGIAVQEFRKQLQVSESRAEALAKVIERRFPQAMEKMQVTFRLIRTNLVDVLQVLASIVGKRFFSLIKKDAQGLYSFLQSLVKDPSALAGISIYLEKAALIIEKLLIKAFIFLKAHLTDIARTAVQLVGLWTSFLSLLFRIGKGVYTVYLYIEKITKILAPLPRYAVMIFILDRMTGILKITKVLSYLILAGWTKITVVLKSANTLLHLFRTQGLSALKNFQGMATWAGRVKVALTGIGVAAAVVLGIMEMINERRRKEIENNERLTRLLKEMGEVVRRGYLPLTWDAVHVARLNIAEAEKLLATNEMQKGVTETNLEVLRRLLDSYKKIVEAGANWNKVIIEQVQNLEQARVWIEQMKRLGEAYEYGIEGGKSWIELIRLTREKLKGVQEDLEAQVELHKALEFFQRKHEERSLKLVASYKEQAEIILTQAQYRLMEGEISEEEFTKILSGLIAERKERLKTLKQTKQRIELMKHIMMLEDKLASVSDKAAKQEAINLESLIRARKAEIEALQLSYRLNQASLEEYRKGLIEYRNFLKSKEEEIKKIGDTAKRTREELELRRELLRTLQEETTLFRSAYSQRFEMLDILYEKSRFGILEGRRMRREDLAERLRNLLKEMETSATTEEMKRETLRRELELHELITDKVRLLWEDVLNHIADQYEDWHIRAAESLKGFIDAQLDIWTTFYENLLDRETTFKEVREELWRDFQARLIRMISELAAMWTLRQIFLLFGVEELFQAEKKREEQIKRIQGLEIRLGFTKILASTAAMKLEEKRKKIVDEILKKEIAIAALKIMTGGFLPLGGPEAGPPVPGGALPAQKGFEGFLKKPTLIYVAERKPEYVKVSPLRTDLLIKEQISHLRELKRINESIVWELRRREIQPLPPPIVSREMVREEKQVSYNFEYEVHVHGDVYDFEDLLDKMQKAEYKIREAKI